MYIFNLIAKLKKICLGYKHFSTFFQKRKEAIAQAMVSSSLLIITP